MPCNYVDNWGDKFGMCACWVRVDPVKKVTIAHPFVVTLERVPFPANCHTNHEILFSLLSLREKKGSTASCRQASLVLSLTVRPTRPESITAITARTSHTLLPTSSTLNLKKREGGGGGGRGSGGEGEGERRRLFILLLSHTFCSGDGGEEKINWRCLNFYCRQSRGLVLM